MILEFEQKGDLRFLSHSETMRLFQRSLIRAGLPVMFSQGFNPRPRLSLPFPRTVGIETENDLLISEISEGGECIRESIQGQLPEGIRIGGCRTAAKKVKRLPIATVYKFYLAENADEASVREKIEEFESAESFIVERVSKKKGKVKQFDVKEYLYNVELREKILSIFVKITQKGTVRIEEIKKIFKITEDILSGPILRTDTEWSGSGAEL